MKVLKNPKLDCVGYCAIFACSQVLKLRGFKVPPTVGVVLAFADTKKCEVIEIEWSDFSDEESEDCDVIAKPNDIPDELMIALIKDARQCLLDIEKENLAALEE